MHRRDSEYAEGAQRKAKGGTGRVTGSAFSEAECLDSLVVAVGGGTCPFGSAQGTLADDVVEHSGKLVEQDVRGLLRAAELPVGHPGEEAARVGVLPEHHQLVLLAGGDFLPLVDVVDAARGAGPGVARGPPSWGGGVEPRGGAGPWGGREQ